MRTRSPNIAVQLFLVTTSLVIPFHTHAAETATLTGIVRDPSDAAVTNAEITIREQNTGIDRHTITNDIGLFTAPSLQPGLYSVRIVAPGFKALEFSDVHLGVAESKQIDFTLEVGDVSQQLTVQGDSAILNTSDGSVGMTVGDKLVSDLPLNGRSFQSLITLAPGITLAPPSAYGQFVVNGQRPTSNYASVDGVSANIGITNISTPGGTDIGSNAAGGTNSLASVDAIEEFRVLTSSLAPEYGRVPGGQIIIRTRSGSNTFHGSLYDYFRNDILNANDWFANSQGQPKPALRFNDYGGVLGGPIVRNRTFFFFSYEGQQMRQPAFTISAVPDITARQSAPPATQPILNAFPIPNGPELGDLQAEFSAGYSNPITTNATSLRLDQIFTPKFTVFARYSNSPSDSKCRGGCEGDSLAEVLTSSYSTQTLTSGLTYVLNPHLVNELRFNLSQSSISSTYSLDDFGGAIAPPQSALFVPPYSPATALAGAYVPFTAVYDGLGGAQQQRQVNLVDSVSDSISSHQIKFGIDYRRLLPFFSPLADLIYGFNDFTAIVDNSLTFSYFTQQRVRADLTDLSLYAQDTWHVSHRLNVTYGLRWELNTPPRDDDANNGNYVPLFGNYATGAVHVGPAGSSLWNKSYLNFAPRLGLAYQLRQRSGWETVLRGGVGLFYDLGLGYSVFGPWMNAFPGATDQILATASLPIAPSQAVLPAVNLAAPPANQVFFAFPRDFALPRTWQWNVALQQSLGSSQTLTISYVAALGRNLVYEQYYRNIPDVLLLFYTDNEGSSDYQSLQLQWERRLSRGLAATAAYSLGHSIDNSSTDFTAAVPTSYFGANSAKGPSDFDIRHTFHAGFTYSLPAADYGSFLRVLSRGWGLSGIVTAQSAPPVNVTYRENIGFGAFQIRPNVVPGERVYIYNSNAPGGKQINPAAFAIDATGEGDLGRNALRGFPLLQTDLSLMRSMRIVERWQLIFRADFFNILNHPNFASPVSELGSGLFGLSTSMTNSQIGGTATGYGLNPIFQTGGPRSVQLSLKLQF